MSVLRNIYTVLSVVAVVALAGCGGGGGGGDQGGGGGGTKPAPPSNVAAVRGAVQLSQFSVTWTPSPSAGVVQYIIYRRLESQASFQQVGTSGGTVFLDTSVPAALAFDQIQYYVTALNTSAIQSDPSNTFTVVQTGGPPPPPF